MGGRLPVTSDFNQWIQGMPINVIPRWVKVLILVLCLAAAWWLWSGSSNPPVQGSKAYLAKPASNLEHGLPGMAGAHIGQFISNPLEPTRLPEEGIVILRDKASSYYKDEPKPEQGDWR